MTIQIKIKHTEKGPLAPMGSSLLGLRMLDPHFSPPSTPQILFHPKSYFFVTLNPMQNFRTL